MRTPEAGLSPADHASTIGDIGSVHEGDSDLDTNDAYGGTMFDIGLAMLQDETYTNEYTTATSDDITPNQRQNSNARLTDSSKVTLMMTDNAAYYTNMSQVTEV